MTAPRRAPAKSRPLSIGALSRATRIPVETLRTWERRYGVPVAIRNSSGHRQFPAAAVDHLRRITALLDQGYRPGEILGLPDDELDGLLGLAARPRAAKAPDSRTAVDPSIESMVRAIEQFDRVSLVAALRTNWARLGPLRFLEDCVTPLLFAVGTGWEEGRLHIRHEHFASECVSDVLRELREPFDRRAAGPRVVLATLTGDLHEGGLLMASMVIALRGHRVLYLGTDTPVEQIAAAVRDGEGDLVVLSVSSTIPRSRAETAVEELRGLLPRRVPLWLGGIGAPVKPPRGVVRLSTLADLDARIAQHRDPGDRT
jgi:methanogenic corrinoid protein MtbC1